jgi:hypothetical protein
MWDLNISQPLGHHSLLQDSFTSFFFYLYRLPGDKAAGLETDHKPPLPICRHGVLFNYVSPGTTLPFTFLVVCFRLLISFLLSTCLLLHPLSHHLILTIRFCVPVEFLFSYFSFSLSHLHSLTCQIVLVFAIRLVLFITTPFPSCPHYLSPYQVACWNPTSLNPPRPPTLQCFLLNSGCAAVKAASGSAHVPYHGRRSVSRCIANPGSARIAPICNE